MAERILMALTGAWVKILSWNVNGFRACVKKGFYEFLRKENPDVLCIQETKQQEVPTLPAEFNYRVVWNPAKRPGYAGTAVFTRLTPKNVKRGMGIEKFDSEGRVITLDLGNFTLVNAYFPHSRRGLERLDFKLEFNRAFARYVKPMGRVVICGDFNVAHREIDIARPKDNEKNAGFTPEERKWMDSFLAKGYVDTFRHLHPDEVKYTWWSYRFNARARNIGWRVDYVVVSSNLIKHVKEAFVMDEVMGSDHAPVGVTL